MHKLFVHNYTSYLSTTAQVICPQLHKSFVHNYLYRHTAVDKQLWTPVISEASICTCVYMYIFVQQQAGSWVLKWNSTKTQLLSGIIGQLSPVSGGSILFVWIRVYIDTHKCLYKTQLWTNNFGKPNYCLELCVHYDLFLETGDLETGDTCSWNYR